MATGTVLTHPKAVSNRLVLLVSGLALAAVVGYSLRVGAAADTSQSLAVLDVDGTTYQVAPAACAVTATDFLLAGVGRVDDQYFWLSASPARAELSTGSSEDVARSRDGDLRLASVGEIGWSTDGGAVEATIVLQDQRDPGAPTVEARLTGECQVDRGD